MKPKAAPMPPKPHEFFAVAKEGEIHMEVWGPNIMDDEEEAREVAEELGPGWEVVRVVVYVKE